MLKKKLRAAELRIKRTSLSFKIVSKNEKQLHFYTGINKPIFEYIYKQLKNKGTKSKILKRDRPFIVLTKLRLGLQNKDLAYRFGICEQKISKVLREWLSILSQEMSKYIYWPEKSSNFFQQIQELCWYN